MNFEEPYLEDPEEDCGNNLYNGVRRPKCNKGLGCVACWEVFNEYLYNDKDLEEVD